MESKSPSEPTVDSPTEEPIIRLTRDGVQYTILGTAHVSRKSAETVERMLGEGDFDAVAVELCATRHRTLTDPTAWEKLDLFRILREGKGGMMMASLALGAYQRRIADQLGVEPGAEMRVALEVAERREIPVQLVDRELGTTLRRAMRRLSWWQRYTMTAGIFFSLLSREKVSEEDIERLKEGDILQESFRALAEGVPELFEPLVAERDRYMAARLRQENDDQPGRKVLVVVGAGHLAGIEEALGEGETVELDREVAQLETTPPPSRFLRALPWILVGLVLAGFGLGFYRSPELGWRLVATWVFLNGTLSAAGALLARGHPVTVLSAFLAAPLTSLNPTIGAGVVTASVETWLRKPTMQDFHTLREDVAELKGWYGNRVSRIFLVFFLSSMGSVLGSWLAGARMFTQLI
ncbi:MAG: TraB/GumN family protein [Gemmatimonadales bacterium]|nr:MAG: TraB/GumN family protein [Gemmatimonadales bacterium]